jgi:hypothetical protein
MHLRSGQGLDGSGFDGVFRTAAISPLLLPCYPIAADCSGQFSPLFGRHGCFKVNPLIIFALLENSRHCSGRAVLASNQNGISSSMSLTGGPESRLGGPSIFFRSLQEGRASQSFLASSSQSNTRSIVSSSAFAVEAARTTREVNEAVNKLEQ